MATDYHTIFLKGCPRYDEAVASGIITPGQLIKIDGDLKVLRHSTAGGSAELLIAREDALQGKSVDDNYAVDDQVGFGIAKPGDELAVMLDAGENVNEGEFLESAGNGNFQEFTSGEKLFVVLEALDLSASSAVATRIRARAM